MSVHPYVCLSGQLWLCLQEPLGFFRAGTSRDTSLGMATRVAILLHWIVDAGWRRQPLWEGLAQRRDVGSWRMGFRGCGFSLASVRLPKSVPSVEPVTLGSVPLTSSGPAVCPGPAVLHLPEPDEVPLPV